jgi:cytidylate kinase
MAILTISREHGSGGEEIGHKVADRLGYQYVDKERLLRDLDEAGSRWGRIARELDEVHPTFWERHDWQYQGFVAQMEALIFSYAAADNVVIIGRGSSFLLQTTPHCLKVRLVAPLKVRVERIMVTENLDQEAAERLIAREDRERAGYIKANYGKDWNKQKRYDLTLNTGNLTHDQVVNILVSGLADKDKLATPAAKTHLQHMALAYRLKARVATDTRLLVPTLEVDLENGALVVSGIIHTPAEESLLKEISREICGDLPVRFNLHHRA